MRRATKTICGLLSGVILASLLTGCSTGNSAPPPATVAAVPGDGIITVTWTMDPSVDYWLFYANASSITSTNWTGIPGARSVMGAVSPYVATGLTNGAVYSFTINGRVNSGPGGPGTPSVSAIPRLAGTATASLPAPWTAGTPLGTSDLRGLTYGTSFVAVGAGGAAYSSPDGTTWTASNTGVAVNLNSAVYRGVYLAAGDGGTILYSTDATNWTVRNAGTANNLYAVATNSGMFVAVGANGTILNSGDGVTWTTAASSATTNDLYAVASYGGGVWVAVGAKGTVLTSADGSTWTARTSNTALDLKGVTFGRNATTGTVVYVAVGAGGTLLTSPDATTWTAQPAIGTNTLSAVTYATQFVAVGANGTIYTSTDGSNWAAQPSATASDLRAIAHARYSYSVIGAAGANLLAK